MSRRADVLWCCAVWLAAGFWIRTFIVVLQPEATWMLVVTGLFTGWQIGGELRRLGPRPW